MLRGYRDTIAPAFGVAIAGAVLAWALYPEKPQLTGNIARQEQRSTYRAGGPDCLPSEIAALRGQERVRRAAVCQEAEEQYRLTTNDLVQQRRAADAADASAVLTYQQTRIAAWGVFLGFITMAAAIAAAWFARRAAIATEIAAKHAEQALLVSEISSRHARKQITVAQQNSSEQLRPYLYLTYIVPEYDHMDSIGYVGDQADLNIIVENFGQSPARHATFQAAAFIALEDESESKLTLGEERVHPLEDIPLGFKKDVPGYYFAGIKERHQALVAGTASLIFQGELTYRYGGKDLRTRFRLVASGENYVKGRFQVAATGNRAD